MDGFVYSCPQIRLFRNDIGYQFVRDIHERLQPPVGKQDVPEAPLLPVTVHHYGYVEKVVEVKKSQSGIFGCWSGKRHRLNMILGVITIWQVNTAVCSNGSGLLN